MNKGCIQIRDTQGDVSCGQFGEISATAAHAAGCVGAVIDGSTRDSNYLIDMGFPTFVDSEIRSKRLEDSWRSITKYLFM
jgi:4-hydroxy-4-methyl-2-oxoglutarate aldolase